MSRARAGSSVTSWTLNDAAAVGKGKRGRLRPPRVGSGRESFRLKVKRGDRTLLVTQLFIAGHAQNARDGILRGAGGIIERELVAVDCRRVENTRVPEYNANFNIVLGVTPDDRPADMR